MLQERFRHIKFIPFGGVLIYLDEQIALCQESAKCAPDELFETFYTEAWAAHVVFRGKIVELFEEMQQNAQS